MKAESRGSQSEASSTSFRNALEFMVENSIKNIVNTAILVRVEAVEASGASAKTGRLTCTPLVAQHDVQGNILEPAMLFDLPYMRYQGGVAAIVCDPCVGDIGLAVFAQQDISLVGETGLAHLVQPASFRSYDMADGLYIGGFLNKAPEIWLELNQEGEATLHAPTKVIVEAPQIEVHAEESISLSAKTIDIQAIESLNIETTNMSIFASAALDITSANSTLNSIVSINGATTINGLATITPDVIIGSMSFATHFHGQVATGLAKTGIPGS